jgi:hypothetical protein
MALSLNLESNNVDDVILRGGPAMYIPGDFNMYSQIASNSKKKMIVSLGFYESKLFSNAAKNFGIFSSISYKPLDFLTVTISPNYDFRKDNLQFIDNFTYQDDNRYLFGEIHQNTFYFTTRINLTITPDFTIQYYGSPFISAGKYSNFKKITDPKAESYNDRFHIYNNSEISLFDEDLVYGISEAANGNYDYYFDMPDFNFKQFRSNLVLRWEYKPGSMLFLVWSQDRTDAVTDGDFRFGDNMKSMFQISPNDIFLIKLSYRFVH